MYTSINLSIFTEYNILQYCKFTNGVITGIAPTEYKPPINYFTGIYKSTNNDTFNVNRYNQCDIILLHKTQLIPLSGEWFIDFGVISENTTKKLDFRVNSAEDLIVEEILIPESFGILLHSPIKNSTLSNFDTIEVEALLGEGAEEVNGFFLIRLSNGNFFKVNIYIKRKIIPIKLPIPDDNSYKESIKLHTASFITQDKTSDNTRLMQEFKYDISYRLTVHGIQNMTAIKNILNQWRLNIMYHPLFAQGVQLEKDTDFNSFLWLDPSMVDFRVGDKVFVYINADYYYFGYILEIYPNGIVIDRKLRVKKGMWVFPSVPAVADGNPTITVNSPTSSDVSIKFLDMRRRVHYVQ